MQKSQATQSVSVLTATGLASKTITDVIVTLHGSVTVIECVESGGSHFIKVKQGVIETGGDINWDSGTKLAQR